MKKHISIICISLAALFSGSCDNWLTVDADNQITRENAIKDGAGFRSTLNGAYLALSTTPLYGETLSYGTVSVMGQCFDLSSYSHSNYKALWAAHSYDYRDTAFEGVMQATWEKAYYAITNLNMIIADIADADPSIFLQGEHERTLILAEARGLRGLMHFDLLRLFAPIPALNDPNNYIPYVTAYPDMGPTHVTVAKAMELVIEDLKFAALNLEYNDTEINAALMRGRSIANGPQARFQANNIGDGTGGIFFGMRGTRMNYFAANALLARAYLYNGDKENAYKSAKVVYDLATSFNFTFTPSGDINVAAPTSRKAKLWHDILFAFYNTNTDTNYLAWYGSNSSSATSRYNLKNIENLFGEDNDDWRKIRVLKQEDYYGLWYNYTTLKWEPSSIYDIQNYMSPLIPVIRLSEVYYIMCEYLADTDLPTAISMLEALRQGRGAKLALNTAMTKGEFLEKLYNDATREFLVEGQTFYLYKRLNRDMYNGDSPINMTGKYVIPLPKSETDV